MKINWKGWKILAPLGAVVLLLLVAGYFTFLGPEVVGAPIGVYYHPALAHGDQFETVNLGKALGIIIPASAASKDMGMLNQCSRSGPRREAIKEFWTPSRGDIAKLERALPAYLKDEAPLINLGNYTRYYLGIVYPNKTIIYVDFHYFHGDNPRAVGLPDDVCDGGNNFFGVEYDTGTGSFSDLEFNGHR